MGVLLEWTHLSMLPPSLVQVFRIAVNEVADSPRFGSCPSHEEVILSKNLQGWVGVFSPKVASLGLRFDTGRVCLVVSHG